MEIERFTDYKVADFLVRALVQCLNRRKLKNFLKRCLTNVHCYYIQRLTKGTSQIWLPDKNAGTTVNTFTAVIGIAGPIFLREERTRHPARAGCDSGQHM